MKQPEPIGRVARFLDKPEQIKGRTFSIYDICHGYGMTDRIESLMGMEVSFMPWRFRSIVKQVDFKPNWNRVNWEVLVSASGFLDAMNVQYLVAPPAHAALFARYGLFRVRRGNLRAALFENLDRMGNAWVNYQARVVDSPEAARDYVLGPDFDPHREVVLEKSPAISYPPVVDRFSTPVRQERRISPTEVEYEVELQRPGLLVVSESGYPGWVAYVDDEPSEWLQANYLLRAVELTPGAHRVRFEYRPWSVRTALVLTVLALIALMGLLFGDYLLRLMRRPVR